MRRGGRGGGEVLGQRAEALPCPSARSVRAPRVHPVPPPACTARALRVRTAWPLQVIVCPLHARCAVVAWCACVCISCLIHAHFMAFACPVHARSAHLLHDPLCAIKCSLLGHCILLVHALPARYLHAALHTHCIAIACQLHARCLPFTPHAHLWCTLLLSPPPPAVPHRVQLAVNRRTEEAVAVKIVDMKRAADCPENIKKEICINKMLNHENVVKFYGHRREGATQYLFLEYCSGGELFDRIGALQNESVRFACCASERCSVRGAAAPALTPCWRCRAGHWDAGAGGAALLPAADRWCGECRGTAPALRCSAVAAVTSSHP